MLPDYHTHTHFSTDSIALPKEHLQKALDLNMKEIGITDHIDYDYVGVDENGNQKYVFDPNKYFAELLPIKERFSEKIALKIGVEIGLNPCNSEKNKLLTSSFPFDYVIGSTHIIDYVDPYEDEYWEGKTTEECLNRFFEATLVNAKSSDDYDVFGHIDYINRYIRDKNFVYSFDDYKDITEEILRAIIERGHGIELNTRGLVKGVLGFVPTIQLLYMYKKLGGEIITVGSDAHATGNIGFGFKSALQILCEHNFKYITTFSERKPSFLPIKNLM